MLFITWRYCSYVLWRLRYGRRHDSLAAASPFSVECNNWLSRVVFLYKLSSAIRAVFDHPRGMTFRRKRKTGTLINGWLFGRAYNSMRTLCWRGATQINVFISVVHSVSIKVHIDAFRNFVIACKILTFKPGIKKWTFWLAIGCWLVWIQHKPWMLSGCRWML